MRGWNIGVHRFAAPALRGCRGDLTSIRALISARTESAEVPLATAEDRQLAGWRAALDGVYWLDELVDGGRAAHTSRGGLPESYLLRYGDLRTRLANGLPSEVFDLRVAEECDAGEWLLVEAWVES